MILIYIYLIRHGETQWNHQSRIQGREDIPLSDIGRQQAAHCAEAFRDVYVSGIISSPLSRAAGTADTLSKATCAEVSVDDRLIERDFGSASGMVIDIFNPEKYASDMEPLDGVASRMITALVDHAADFGGDYVAVSHGASINAVLKKLSSGEIGSGKTRLKNACINVLEFANDKFTIIDYNLDADEFTEKYKKG